MTTVLRRAAQPVSAQQLPRPPKEVEAHPVFAQGNHRAVIEHSQQHDQDRWEVPGKNTDTRHQTLTLLGHKVATPANYHVLNTTGSSVTPNYQAGQFLNCSLLRRPHASLPVVGDCQDAKGEADPEGHCHCVLGVGRHALEYPAGGQQTRP